MIRIEDHPTWHTLHMSDTEGYDVVLFVRGLNEGKYEAVPWRIDEYKFKRYGQGVIFDSRADAQRWCLMHHMTGA